MIYEFPGALPHQKIILSRESLIEEANCVLIFPFYQGKWVLVNHHSRGWELPGGMREEGETLIQTVHREMYEEAGGRLDGIEGIGQYLIFEREQLVFVKTIYISTVSVLEGLPGGFETNDVRLLAALPMPSEIRDDPAYSPYMKDDVYAIVSEWVKDHVFTREEGEHAMNTC
ncbi:NUDIX domain-containing protein [Paenibacillus whitsoniae]|uniref:NUDIX domain-containing protein n=1 Tax=Paenibacillus whitsoniae TaxID=2496558 RepID=UPI0013DF96D2|nr:NUDIX domain-containing protein [Paenibacillus whitsoniae]